MDSSYDERRMKAYTVAVDIDLPRDRVVELFDDPENLLKWQTGLQSFEHLSGEPGHPGARSKLVFQSGKHRIELLETVTVRDLPDEFSGTYEWNGGKNRRGSKPVSPVLNHAGIPGSEEVPCLHSIFFCTGSIAAEVLPLLPERECGGGAGFSIVALDPCRCRSSRPGRQPGADQLHVVAGEDPAVRVGGWRPHALPASERGCGLQYSIFRDGRMTAVVKRGTEYVNVFNLKSAQTYQYSVSAFDAMANASDRTAPKSVKAQ